MTERERIISVLKRQKPDRVPWATRLDIWLGSHQRTGDLPAKYQVVQWILNHAEVVPNYDAFLTDSSFSALEIRPYNGPVRIASATLLIF